MLAVVDDVGEVLERGPPVLRCRERPPLSVQDQLDGREQELPVGASKVAEEAVGAAAAEGEAAAEATGAAEDVTGAEYARAEYTPYPLLLGTA